jgi:hypothetical protein
MAHGTVRDLALACSQRAALCCVSVLILGSVLGSAAFRRIGLDELRQWGEALADYMGERTDRDVS